MALITCPECGKQVSDKATACPNCGCPISAAQPSAVEITAPVVEPASSVSAPKSNDFEKYMTLARRAKEDSNAENAARYYDLALRENPLSWEASFYQVYFTVEQCKIIQIESAARAVANCQSSVLTLIRDHVP